MNSSKPVLYFDITDIVEHAMNHPVVTGIQRSVLKILESIVRQNDGRPVFGLVRHPLTDSYMAADLSFLREPYDLEDFALRFELSSGKSRWLAGKLRRYRNRPLRRLLHASRLQLQWASSKKLRDEVLNAPQEARPSSLTDCMLEEGSYIVTLGAGWGTDYAGLSRFSHLQGCKLVTAVHDIIPLSGRFFAKDKNGRFRDWVYWMAREASLVLSNSAFTKRELEAYLRANGLDASITIVAFPQEFKYSSDRQKHAIRDQVINLARRCYVLCAGTIETRKNTVGLLRAWHEIQKVRGAEMPVLVLAGGKGRGAEEAQALLRETANIGGTVTIVEKPNDAELELLYQHCQFTAFPSLYEGWGLPIGESLWFGKPVLCASNASMPEVGGSFATYFDHGEPGSLLQKLQEMIDNPPALPPDIRDHLISWNDTAASICAAIDACESKP